MLLVESLDLRGGKGLIPDDEVPRLGNRNTGIGINQLAMIEDCDDADARLSFRNPDGSPLDACGSATRGAADRRPHFRRYGGWRDIPLAQEADTLAADRGRALGLQPGKSARSSWPMSKASTSQRSVRRSKGIRSFHAGP